MHTQKKDENMAELWLLCFKMTSLQPWCFVLRNSAEITEFTKFCSSRQFWRCRWEKIRKKQVKSTSGNKWQEIEGWSFQMFLDRKQMPPTLDKLYQQNYREISSANLALAKKWSLHYSNHSKLHIMVKKTFKYPTLLEIRMLLCTFWRM